MTLDELDEAWQVLTFREKDILTKRFGLDGEKPMTLRATGKVIGVCNQRIVQIQAGAMRKLRCAIREIETHGKLLPTTTVPNGTVPSTIAVTKWKTKPVKRRPRKSKPPLVRHTETERLDWMEDKIKHHSLYIDWKSSVLGESRWTLKLEGNYVHEDSLRDLLDRAMMK